MPDEIQPRRLGEVRRQIRALQLAEHPVVRLVHPEGPHEHKLAYRAWAEVPEPGKLSMLLDLVDWSGISNKAMAAILLNELDVGKLTSGQRDMLIRLAEPEPAARQGKMTLDELKQMAARQQPEQVKQREHGMER